MSVPTLAVPSTAPARPSPTGPGGPPSRLPRGSQTRWDPLRFAATAKSAPTSPTPPTSQPQLVWSNGKARQLPDPGTWCATVARACAEALHGTRPCSQLHRWLDVEIFTSLQRRADLAARMRSRGVRSRAVRVRRVHPCRIRTGVWEASVVLQDGPRVRAAAIRIEAHRGHWRATAVQFA